MTINARIVWVLCCWLTSRYAQAQAEFFLQLNDPGRYTVSLDDQTLTLSSGRYRFFDLPAGRLRLTISQQNNPIYQDWVNLRTDSRTVAELGIRQGMHITAVFALSPDSRAGMDWASPPGTTRSRPDYPGAYDNRRMAMPAPEFDRVREVVKKQSFDDGRFELLRTLIVDRPLSSAQLAELLRLFTFDTKRLEVAKMAWSTVTDRQYFYTVFDTFTFSTSVNELKAFMGTR